LTREENDVLSAKYIRPTFSADPGAGRFHSDRLGSRFRLTFPHFVTACPLSRDPLTKQTAKTPRKE
jgi:hypothetical protein